MLRHCKWPALLVCVTRSSLPKWILGQESPITHEHKIWLRRRFSAVAIHLSAYQRWRCAEHSSITPCKSCTEFVKSAVFRNKPLGCDDEMLACIATQPMTTYTTRKSIFLATRLNVPAVASSIRPNAADVVHQGPFPLTAKRIVRKTSAMLNIHVNTLRMVCCVRASFTIRKRTQRPDVAYVAKQAGPLRKM